MKNIAKLVLKSIQDDDSLFERITEQLFEELYSKPNYEQMSDEEIDKVADEMNDKVNAEWDKFKAILENLAK